MGVVFSAISEALSVLRSYDENDSAVKVQRRSAIVQQNTLNYLRRRLGIRKELRYWFVDDSELRHQLDALYAQCGMAERYIEEDDERPVPIAKVREIFQCIGKTLYTLHSGIEAGVVKSECEFGRTQRFQRLWAGISCGLLTIAIFALVFQSQEWIGIGFLILSLLANIISLKATLNETEQKDMSIKNAFHQFMKAWKAYLEK